MLLFIKNWVTNLTAGMDEIMLLLVCLFSSLIVLLIYALGEDRGKNSRFARQYSVTQDINLTTRIITSKEYLA